ncbi:MAG: hypothetical protein ACI9FB_001184 [Candidatus Azotimanducaceae bacterium]|jgi:hypothetical protein
MNSELVVRTDTIEDNAALIELWRICFLDDPSCNNSTDINRYKLLVQPELLMFCTADSRLFGSVLAGYDGFRGWIDKVATHSGYQDSGCSC